VDSLAKYISRISGAEHYVTDQLAMARLLRATFALMLALLPAAATVVGLLVLGQMPTGQDMLGMGLVIAGVACTTLRRPRRAPPSGAKRQHRPLALRPIGDDHDPPTMAPGHTSLRDARRRDNAGGILRGALLELRRAECLAERGGAPTRPR
jgi:hypothetical protein